MDVRIQNCSRTSVLQHVLHGTVEKEPKHRALCRCRVDAPADQPHHRAGEKRHHGGRAEHAGELDYGGRHRPKVARIWLTGRKRRMSPEGGSVSDRFDPPANDTWSRRIGSDGSVALRTVAARLRLAPDSGPGHWPSPRRGARRSSLSSRLCWCETPARATQADLSPKLCPRTTKIFSS
jgi:hypothetical protein